MTFPTVRLVLLVAAAFLLTSASATSAAARQATGGPQTQAQDELTVARKYFALMVAGDLAGQAAMLSEDAVFEDPTTSVTGRDAITAAWASQNIRFLGFEEDAAFHSGGGLVVINGVTRFEQAFPTASGSPLTLAFVTRTTTAITVRDNQIVRHVDYVDMVAFSEQLQAHMRRLRGA